MRALIPILALSALSACASTGATTAELDTAPDCFVQEPAANPDGYVWRSVRCADSEPDQIRLDERETSEFAYAGPGERQGGRTELRMDERREFALREPAPPFRYAPPSAYPPAPYAPPYPPAPAYAPPVTMAPIPNPDPRSIAPKGGPFIDDPFAYAPPAPMQPLPRAPSPELYQDGLAGGPAVMPPPLPRYEPLPAPEVRYGAVESGGGSYGAASGGSYSSSTASSSSLYSSLSTGSASRSGYESVQGGHAGSSLGQGLERSSYSAGGLRYGSSSSYSGGSSYSASGYGASGYGASGYGASGYGDSSGYVGGYASERGAAYAGEDRYGAGGYGYAYGSGQTLPGYAPSQCVSDAGRFAAGRVTWDATSCQSASARLWTSGSGIYSSGGVQTSGPGGGLTRDVAGRDAAGFLTWPGKTPGF